MHCMELPFVSENVDRMRALVGTGQEQYVLADKMSTAWASFMRSGSPTHKGLPNWPVFDTNSGATMIFNRQCRIANDPYGEERDALAAIRENRRSAS